MQVRAEVPPTVRGHGRAVAATGVIGVVEWRDAQGHVVCYRCRERGHPDRVAVAQVQHGTWRPDKPLVVPMCGFHVRRWFDRHWRRLHPHPPAPKKRTRAAYK